MSDELDEAPRERSVVIQKHDVRDDVPSTDLSRKLRSIRDAPSGDAADSPDMTEKVPSNEAHYAARESNDPRALGDGGAEGRRPVRRRQDVEHRVNRWIAPPIVDEALQLPDIRETPVVVASKLQVLAIAERGAPRNHITIDP